MFNPQNTTDVRELWKRLSTFYNLVDAETRSVIETYWKALLNGLEGLHYDLAQNSLTAFLDYTPGYIEDVLQEHYIDFDLALDGKYTHKIANDNCYLTIPELSGLATNTVYKEGVDYVISGMHYITFSGLSTQASDTFVAPLALHLLPSITNIYFPAFGETEHPEKVVSDNYYVPFVSGYNEMENLDKQIAYARHLKCFVQAVSNVIMRGPSFKNLYTAFAIISGMPFAYDSGTVTNINNGYITVSGNTVDSYKLINNLTTTLKTGDTVDKFQILASGISLHDHVKSPNILTQITEDNTEEYWYTLGIERSNRTYGLSCYPKFVEFFNNVVKPVNLVLNYFNLPPVGATYSDKLWYSKSNVISMSGLISDPESDILNYNWTQISPLTSVSGIDIAVPLLNSNKIACTGIIKEPPVDREFAFRLTVTDSDNAPNFDVFVNVSGAQHFTTWGNSTFMLGDAELKYKYLPGAN